MTGSSNDAAFEGRRFVITGGAGGIGRACARQLLEGGAQVLLVDLAAGRLEEARDALGGGHRRLAKAGVVGLARALSRQFAPPTLVNAVAPNAIVTGMTESVFKERGDTIQGTIPLGRFGTADEVASAVTFLCSDGASFITGQTINIDVGVSNS